MFFVGLTISSGFGSANSLNAISLSCISMRHQECKTRPKVVKCSVSCNNINYPYGKTCVPDVVKNLNVKYSI